MDRNTFGQRPGVLLSCRSLRGNVDRNYGIYAINFLNRCRSLRGNVDRNSWQSWLIGPGTCRSLRGNVDRNSAMRLTAVTTLFCRSLRGNVDRNTIGFCKHFRWRGRSLRGNVDRNIMSTDGFPSKAVVPYVGTWIEIFSSAYCTSGELCRSLRGNVDRNLIIHNRN